MLNGLETRPLAPFDLLFINGQREFRPAPEQSLQCAYALKARKLMAKTKMNSGAEIAEKSVKTPLMFLRRFLSAACATRQ